MIQADFLVHLDQLRSSYLVVLLLVLLVSAAIILFKIGLIEWAMITLAGAIRGSIHHGFQLWRRFFSWATWRSFLVMVATSLLIGWATQHQSMLTVVFAMIPLFMGTTACLAYMHIDLERYAVSRGHKAVHNPLAGQELAVNLVQHGQAVGVPLLVTAAAGMIGGFALLNLGLYQTIGRDWYIVAEGQPDPTYVDFLANALIVLFKIVDVLDFAKSSHLLDVSYVHQARGPATSLLTAFRMFSTLVLLQQVFASFRQGQLLSETITDLWNPNEPIHQRACHALPQYGPGAIGPLLISLGTMTLLTKEQRERLPTILAEIGPAAIPTLVRHLHDKHEHVRAIAAAALGHLRVRKTIVLLIPLCQDDSDIVRQCLTEALGNIASHSAAMTDAKDTPMEIRRRPLTSLNWGRASVPVAGVDPIQLAVHVLQGALSDRSLMVRALAARALGRIGPPAAVATDAVIALLRDEIESVRLEAILAVGKMAGPSAATVAALIDTLQDASPELRATAARELGAMGTDAAAAFAALALLLRDPDDQVRDAVATAIGQSGELKREAASGLVMGLTSPDNVVRANTAEGLGTIGETAHETAPALVAALADQNDAVRAKAAEALGRIGESVAEIAVPGLVRALRDQDIVVSALAASALGQMGQMAELAIPSLIDSLQHINANMRASSAESLGKLGRDVFDAASGLERACRDDDPDVRSKAIHALGLLGLPEPTTKQRVLAGLTDANSQVRLAAVDTLYKWGNLEESTWTLLLPLLDDPNEDVRLHATTVLPRLMGATAEVIEVLCRRLQDDIDVVQVQAALALGDLGPVAAAAAESLLHAATTAGTAVREQSRKAIVLIRASETLVSMNGTTWNPALVEALREIEQQPSTCLDETTDPDVPMIVIASLNSEGGQTYDAPITLGIVLSDCDSGKIVQNHDSISDSVDESN